MNSIDDGALNGTFALRHREIFKELFGEEVLRAAIADLDADARKAVEQLTPSSWIPVSAMEDLFAAVAKRVGRDPGDLHGEMAHIASERTIRTLWRILLRLASDEALVARAPVFYSKTWNRGTLLVRVVKPGLALGELKGWPDTPAMAVRGVRIAMSQALTLTGRRGVHVEATRTADGARYEIRWSPS